jgi:hypothetical protein
LTLLASNGSLAMISFPEVRIHSSDCMSTIDIDGTAPYDIACKVQSIPSDELLISQTFCINLPVMFTKTQRNFEPKGWGGEKFFGNLFRENWLTSLKDLNDSIWLFLFVS